MLAVITAMLPTIQTMNNSYNMECIPRKNCIKRFNFLQQIMKKRFDLRFQVLRATPKQEVQFNTGGLIMKRFMVVVLGL